MASLPFFMILNPTHSCKYQQLILKGYSSMLELSQVPTTDLSSIDYSKKLFFQKKKKWSLLTAAPTLMRRCMVLAAFYQFTTNEWASWPVIQGLTSVPPQNALIVDGVNRFIIELDNGSIRIESFNQQVNFVSVLITV